MYEACSFCFGGFGGTVACIWGRLCAVLLRATALLSSAAVQSVLLRERLVWQQLECWLESGLVPRQRLEYRLAQRRLATQSTLSAPAGVGVGSSCL